MKKTLSLVPLLPALATTLLAAGENHYEISFANRVHHEAEVRVRFTDVPAGPLVVRMSRTSPGRYALHEFGKNVYGVRAADGAGRKLSVSRPNPHQWDVSGHDGVVVFSYTVFGDRTDGTYLSIDETHAHMNIPATFVWARGLESRPIRVRFELPEAGWRVATQLKAEADGSYSAPDLAYFLDSPTELSDHHLEEWQLPDGQTVAVAIHHDGTAAEAEHFARAARAIVNEQIAVFGEVPRFDYGRYVFIADYRPGVNGDGMEHRNSTILTSTRPLSGGGAGNLGTVSHEFFHAWNVERLRPASLEPFDFEAPNPSGELWFAEGFTSYYGPLTMKRAGITSLDAFARSLGSVNAVINGAGRALRSAVEMSGMATVVDGASWRDPTNTSNTFISYYTHGAALGLALDLSLRSSFDGTSLDDLMAALWQSHGRAERPYTNADIRSALGRLTDASFADVFFDRFVEGREAPDFKNLLEAFGFVVRPRRPDGAWLGNASLQFDEEGILLGSGTVRGTPLYAAGLERGDRIVSIAGKRFQSPEDLNEWLEERTIGERVEVVFSRRSQDRTSTLALAADPRLEVVPFEHAGRTLSAETARRRDEWLGPKARPMDLHRYCPVCKRDFPFEYTHCHFDGTALELTPPK